MAHSTSKCHIYKNHHAHRWHKLSRCWRHNADLSVRRKWQEETDSYRILPLGGFHVTRKQQKKVSFRNKGVPLSRNLKIGYASVMCIALLVGGLFYYTNGSISPPPTQGTLKVLAYYSGSLVVASVTVNPGGYSGVTTTSGNPLSFILNAGSYTISGTYSGGLSTSTTATVTAGSIQTATLTFGGGSSQGTLKVFAYQNSVLVVASVNISPGNYQGTTTTNLGNPLSFTLNPVTYTVSGTYNSQSISTTATVTAGGSATATLTFSSSGEPITWKDPPLICIWWWWYEQYANYPWVAITEAQLRADIPPIKSMGINTICSSDKMLELAPATADVAWYETNCVTPRYAQICAENGLYVILVLDQLPETNSYHGKWARSHSEFGQWMNNLGKLAQKYANIIGILIDDCYRLWEETGDQGLLEFHTTARTNLDAGAERQLHVVYATYGTHAPTTLNGQKLTSMISCAYWASVGAPDAAPDPAGTAWVQALTKYYDPNLQSSTGPAFNCQNGESGVLRNSPPQRDPPMWAAQAQTAINNNFYVYHWYCWQRCTGDQYGVGIKSQPQWWDSIRLINQNIMSFFQS